MWKAYLYNQAEKKIKVDCTAIMGKHDYAPRYECADKTGKKSVAFDLGTEWKPVSLSPVCMKNRATDVVKSDYFEYETAKDGRVAYLDVNKDTEEYMLLGKQWEPLPRNDSQCEPLTLPELDDPPKNFEFEIIPDLEQPADKENEQ